MSTTAADLLPTAKKAIEILALAEAEKALVDRPANPHISEQEALERAAAIINRAVKNGLTEVEVLRFPNVLCIDRGRAINNNMEPGYAGRASKLQ